MIMFSCNIFYFSHLESSVVFIYNVFKNKILIRNASYDIGILQTAYLLLKVLNRCKLEAVASSY